MGYSRDSGPKYREAYPRVDILKAAANVRQARDICVFEFNEFERLECPLFHPKRTLGTASVGEV